MKTIAKTVLALLFAIIFATCATAAVKDIPKITLKTIDGREIAIAGNGKPAVLNFWATWCPPCRGEMREINAAAEELEKSGIKLIAVNLTDGGRDTPAKVKKYAEKEKFTMTVALDEGMKLAEYLGVTAIPTTMIFDAKGKCVKQILGATTKEKIVKESLEVKQQNR